MTSRRLAQRRLGGLTIMGIGALLAIIVAIALIVADFRLAALAPADQRVQILEHGIRVSLAWAAGTGVVIGIVGFGVWVSARTR